MLLCANPQVAGWTPDFSSSGLPSPRWSRLTFGGIDLCNSLEFVDWTANPVQVEICDQCGTIGCGPGGYVHASRMSDLVLWTAPQIDTTDEFARAQFAPANALSRYGSIAIPAAHWERIREIVPDVPIASSLPPTNATAIADAWVRGKGRNLAAPEVPSMLTNRLIACDTLEPDLAVQHVRDWLRQVASRPDLTYGLFELAETQARPEKLYFEGPGSVDWCALAELNGQYYPLLGTDSHYLLIPTETPIQP